MSLKFIKNGLSRTMGKLLNPEVFRDRIINISMYITIYEMLKDSIIVESKTFLL